MDRNVDCATLLPFAYFAIFAPDDPTLLATIMSLMEGRAPSTRDQELSVIQARDVPLLPHDLERECFEWSASSEREMIFTLILVAQRVHFWYENLPLFPAFLNNLVQDGTLHLSSP